MPESDNAPIHITANSSREGKRRKRELFLALFCFLLIGLLTFIELKYLGVNSYLFLGLFNVNFILLLIILFIVARNGVKLLLERKRNVLGAKLRTRLVLAFMTLTLIPTILMFIISVRFVQTSVDYWFKVQVEDSMEEALDLGRAFYKQSQQRLEQRGEFIIEDIIRRKYAWGGKSMDGYLEEKFAEYNLGGLAVLRPDGKIQNAHNSPQVQTQFTEIREKLEAIQEDLKRNPRYWSTIMPTAGSDLIIGVMPVDKGETGYLVIIDHIGEGLLYKLDQVVRGLEEYKKLNTLKSPWKMTLFMSLGVMTMLIILGSIWYGFRLAKELTAPVQALAKGTERVSKGDLDVRLEDKSGDELGILVQSFNRMTGDLAQSRAELEHAYETLETQNEELERRGYYIEAILNNITSGVISMDTEGRVGTVNLAAQAMLGINPVQLIGQRPLAMLQGELATLVQEADEQMRLKPGSQWSRQLDISIKGRPRKLLVSMVTLKNEHGDASGTVAVFEDITELEKMQRVAAWREVARRIAHEIKNPLTPIKLSAQRLQRKYGPVHEEKTFTECTSLIIQQVERMQTMVTEFSTYAKLPEVAPTPSLLAPLLEEVVSMFKTTHVDIEWGLTFKTPIQEFAFDPEGMRKVFINLLTNAVEALKEEKIENGQVDITVTHFSERGLVKVTVQDNGPGFSPSESSRMFEPYFSGKKTGTGLGLTIVRSIIKDHGGTIQAFPAPEQGTIFTVELPDA
ncbi:MAG: ATP-binding protein [Desulfovibrio sp.]